MSMQQFCLRWNNHQPNFISVFSSLLNNETLVDVTLAAEGRHLQAHKVVLSACSTYFQSLFTVNPCQHPIVILKDVKFTDLKIMVDFMYYGEVNVSQDQLPSIIKTAESLKIKGLAEMHTASLTKWPSGSSEPGGGGGGGSVGGGVGDRGDSCSPSPSPLSPSFRRKRLRKTSTGSTSAGSAEKTEEMNEITLVATSIVKPEPLIVSQESGENLRRPVNTATESQGSIDEDQISIMSNMESSTATTPAQSEGSLHEVSQQSGGNIGQSSVSSQPPSHQVQQSKQVGTKRGVRLLTRQPRVKKESEPSQRVSTEIEPSSSRIVASSFSSSRSSSSCSSVANSTITTLNLVPSRESSFDESTETTVVAMNATQINTKPTTNLLTVPQPTYLVKQHSHPLLPSQQTSNSCNYWIQRQLSNPEYPGGTTSPKVNEQIPLIKIEEGESFRQDETYFNATRDSASSTPAGESRTSATGLRIIPAELLLRNSSSVPQAIAGPNQTVTTNVTSSGTSTTTIASETRVSRDVANDQRLGHCPVQRPGPALGCNHCWNTIDTHGRILRRKTKYHCPECQLNLCIVPCFQEFHERPRETANIKPLPKTSSI